MSDMEEILAELQRMIEVNPEAYQKIMESMSKSLYLSGTNTNDNLPHVSGISSNDGVESDNISQGNMSINQMAEAIMHMRNASVDVEGKEPDLIMSKDKPKQVLFIDINDDIRSVDHFMILMMMMIVIIIIIAFVITSLHYIDIAKRNPHNSNSWLYI